MNKRNWLLNNSPTKGISHFVVAHCPFVRKTLLLAQVDSATAMLYATAKNRRLVTAHCGLYRGKTRFCGGKGARERRSPRHCSLDLGANMRVVVVLAIWICALFIASGSALALPQINFGQKTSSPKPRSSVTPGGSDLPCLPLSRCPALKQLLAVNPNGIGEFDTCGEKMFRCPRLKKPETSQDCRCLPIPKCPALHNLAKERNFDELRRFKRCGYDRGAIKLCCPQDGIKRSQENDVIREEPLDQSESGPSTINKDKRKPVDQPSQTDMGEPLDDRIGDTNSTEELDGICLKDDDNVGMNEGLSCGYSSLSVRIRGGQDADSHDYPWAAAIAYNEPKSNKLKYACGGALIHSNYVLTAAHCTRDLRGNTLAHVKLGHADLNHPCGVEVGIDTVHPHPNYDPAQNYINDIALLKLVKPVDVGATINLLCLPIADEEDEGDTDPVVVGWGITENGTNSDVLQELGLEVIPNDECTNEYRQSFIKRNFSPAQASTFNISSTQMCAKGPPGNDSCRGDSGGPLMSTNSIGQWVMNGVVSFGNNKCDSEVPGVYTRVSKYLEWIGSVINPIS